MTPEDPLYISKRNRRGLAALIALCFIIIFTPRILMFFEHPEIITFSSEEITAFKKKHRYKKRYFSNHSYKNYEKKKRFHLPPQKFNPNDYSKEQWMDLGLSEKQAAIVLKFSKNGLRSNDDLKRIFVISDELFALIKDSIYYPERPKIDYESKKVVEEKVIEKLNINTATIEELESLKGIGPFFAKQIIKYRDQLGGFAKKEQILEVWKLTIESYETLTPQIEINKSGIKKINLNTITVEELNAHPYLNWSQANSIVKMRMQRTKFSDVNEIKESKLIDEETFEKLIPYLSL